MRYASPNYPSSAAVRRAKAAIEKTGSVVTSVRLFPDGAMEFITTARSNDDELSEFDRLDAAGLL
jgi:hypothetical protein